MLIAAGRRSVHSMRLSHILGQYPSFCLPTCIRRPCWVGGFRQNIAVTFGTEKLKWCGYRKVKTIEDMFIRFDRMHLRK